MPLQTFYRRYSVSALIAAVCLVPVLLFGVRGALQNVQNDVRQWLPSGFQETREYDWFLTRFGSEEMIVASWPGCTLQDPRLERFSAGLAPYISESEAASQSSGDIAYFRRVVTGSQVLQDLTGEPINLSHREAARRMQGVLLGPDGKTSGAVITVSALGAANRHAALDVVYTVAAQAAGITRDELRLGGPTVDSVALDSEGNRSRYLLSALSVLLSLVLAWCCLRQVRLVALAFAAALLCGATSVALVHFTGGEMNLLMIMMPTMVYVLAISAAIHLTNCYRQALQKVNPAKAPALAVSEVWRPCTLAALTTALGLFSLGLSEVIPVKMFGIYAGLGVLVSVPIVLMIIPAGLQLWPPPVRARRRDDVTPLSERLDRICSFLIRRHRPIVVLNLILMGVLGAGILQLETSVKLLNLFSPNSRIIQDYTWLEKNLGPLVPVELVVHFEDQEQPSTLDQMRLVANIQQQLGQIEKVDGVLSAVTFMPPLPEGRGIRNTMKRSRIDRRLKKDAEQGSPYLQTAEQSRLWRISARIEALNALDYGQFMTSLQDRVDPVLESAEMPGVRVTYTGLVPLVYKAQRLLLDDLTKSFLCAFVLIAIVMIFMLRGVKAGLASMLPNLLPAIVIFGGMGWMGRVCDIGSMMTASVAMGIAVDDTTHFLAWFRRGLADGLSREAAIRLSFQRCAPAMFQSTLICSLGLLVFAFSSFVPTARFAYMMATLLIAALLGDLLFLPALLASPFGRYFESAKEPQQQPAVSNATVSVFGQ